MSQIENNTNAIGDIFQSYYLYFHFEPMTSAHPYPDFCFLKFALKM